MSTGVNTVEDAIESRHLGVYRLQQFIVRAPSPIVMVDRDLKVLLYTQAWAFQWKLEGLGDLTGKSLGELFSEYVIEKPDIVEACNMALAGRAVSHEADDWNGLRVSWRMEPFPDPIDKTATAGFIWWQHVYQESKEGGSLDG